ncbi:MAG TPA: ATP-binding protein, partial [Acetobacteraceae bacterium]|nr:ATP-binding protein [Acetobacteraceae bacterium]
MQDVRLISLTPLAGSRGQIATALARGIGDDDLLIMLSGPEGSGKSAILAAVAATLAYGGMRTIRVSNPDGSTMGQRELAARILGRPTMGSPAQLVAEAITSLIATTDNGQVVLVVDDAHTLTDQAMELLLVISSPVRPGGSGPQLILAGRGAFWDRPWRDELRSLTDLAEKIELEPLTIEDARDFVMAEAAAAAGTVISVTPDALAALVRCSSGLAAGMNRIVTEAVVLGNHRQITVLTEEIVDAVVTHDTLIEPPCTNADLSTPRDAAVIVPDVAAPEPVIQKKPRGRWPAIAATAVIALAGASVGLVPSLRTQVASLFGGSTPEAARGTSPVTDA